MESNRLIRLAPFAAWLTFASACAHYVAKPLLPEQTLQQLQQRRLTDPAFVASVHAVTQSTTIDTASADGSATHWGRLQLLVAALELNPSVTEARAQLAQVSAGLRTARALQNPTVNLSTEYNLSRVDESPWLWGVSTAFLTDTLSARPLRIDLAQEALQSAHADFREALWAVRRELRAALLAVTIAAKRIAALEHDARERTDLERLAQARVASGESARSESLQTQLELSRSGVALEDARRLAIEAQRQLALTLGVTPAALDEITPTWDDLDNLTLPPAAELQSLRDRALLSRPDMERAIADYRARELDLRQQMGAQLQASLGPGFTWDHGVRRLTLGASLALPIFNQNQGPIAEAVAARESAGLHALTVQATILSEIDAATAAYANARTALERVRQQRAANEALAADAQRQFHADVIDRPTWLAADLAVSTERIAELDALERAQQALGQLEDALRTPLSGPETRLPALDLHPSPAGR